MVSIPSGVNVPGSDKATIDIAAALNIMSPSCTFGHKPMFVVAIAKPTNSILPLFVPVAGATIETRQKVLGVEKERKTGYANLNGIYWICIPVPFLSWSEFRVKQYNVDFGNGMAQFSNWKLVSEVSVFKGDIDTPCPSFTPLIGVANFDKLTSTPTVFTQPVNLNFSGYGTIPMSGTFEVKVNGTVIGSGNVSNGKVTFSYPGTTSDLLTKFPSLKSPAKVDLIIHMGSCTFINSTTISLPSLVLPTPPCTGSFVATLPDFQSIISKPSPPSTLAIPIRLTGGKTTVPVRILVDGREIDRRDTIYGLDIIRTFKTAGADLSKSHTITIESLATDCTIPPLSINVPALTPIVSIPGCSQLITTVDSINHPAEITSLVAPFYVYLRGIKEICRSDPTNPDFIKKLPKGTIGTITLGNLSSNFQLTDDGIVDIDLSKLINLPSLTSGGALTISIRDYRYSTNVTLPGGAITIEKPTLETRIVKILPEGENRLPDANAGETVKITATVICKTGATISKPRDTAYLIIDGAIADRNTVENGIVKFEWEATAVPISIHTICVKVDPSATCKSPGQDCKRITVSPTTLSIAEQLAKEKASSAEQRKLLEQARSRLREEIIGAELQVPGYPIIPYTPSIITPELTIPITQIKPPTEPISEYGNISIIGLPANLPLTPELPIYVYIDDKSIGRLYELPKTVTNITVGIHSVYARGGDITSPTKTAVVRKDETTNVTI